MGSSDRRELLAQEMEGTGDLRTIMVTASRIIQELMDVPTTVNVITADDIEKEPYASITDLLRTIPGIGLNESSARAGNPRVSIRGESHARTLVFINGVKLADKESGDPSLLINLSQVDRIEVIKGPASVLYGSEAIGGVLNIVTKQGGTKPIGFSQNFIYDSSTDSIESQTAIFGKYNGVNYRVSGSGKNAHNRRVPSDISLDGISEAVNSHYRNRYYSAQIGYDWNKNSFTLMADRYENESFYSSGRTSLEVSKLNIYWKPNDRDTVVGTLIMQDLTDQLKKLTLSASYQIYNREFITDNTNSSGTTYRRGDVKTEQRQTSFTALSEWQLGKHYLTGGLESEWDDVLAGIDTEFYSTGSHTISNARVKQLDLGLFAQDEWSITENFKATIGARFIYIKGDYVSREGLYEMGQGPDSHSASKLVGSLGLVYRGFSDWAFRAQFSQGYRYPTVRQLYTGNSAMGYSNPSQFYLPNPNLKPETSNNFEIGARYMDEKWDFDLALFYTSSKNFIDTVSSTSTTAPTYVNGDKAETIGAELSASFTHNIYGFSINPYGNATMLRRTVTIYPGRVSQGRSKTNKTNIPPIEGRVGVKVQKPFAQKHNFFADAYVDMAIKTKSNLDVGSGATTNISAATNTFPAWQTFNVTLGVSGGESHRYNVSVNLRNIFNQSYIMSRGSRNLAEPGFHVILGAGVEF
jgi:hemoglobin/transferrin/lactoferrin receptor protein